MERAGAAAQQIVERMYQIRRNVQIVLTMDKLDYARMSGRVGALQAALASALNVKPIVVLREGLLDMAEKVRTRGKALDRVLEMLHNRFEKEPVHVAVVHARDLEIGPGLVRTGQESFQHPGAYHHRIVRCGGCQPGAGNGWPDRLSGRRVKHGNGKKTCRCLDGENFFAWKTGCPAP